MNQEFLNMKKLDVLITEGKYKEKLNENKFTDFVKNTFSSKTKDQELAASAAKAAEEAEQKQSKEEVAKLESLTSDPEFKKLMDSFTLELGKIWNSYEEMAQAGGNRGDVMYMEDEINDKISKSKSSVELKNFIKSKGINPELIKDLSRAIASLKK